MSFVLDASITVAWLNEQETTPAIEATFSRLALETAVVPSLWWLEVANALSMAVRRRRFSPAKRSEYLDALRGLPIEGDRQTHRHAWDETLALADTHDLTLYDAAYLELALRQELPLATLDQALRTAAAGERVLLLGI